ncbi:MAG: hypothetical protein LBC08_03060, partial [Campylobacteraceae bacterium]|nr:hypothetical protein [Campylobacteraceae bacterium]
MKIALIPMIAALCILTAAAENVTSAESSSISENAESYLADKVWECSSYVRAFNTDIRLYSRDIYYADKSYDSQPTISFEAPLSYRSVITLDNAVKGVWSVENATFIAGTLNGSKRDEMPIIELTNNRFVTKTSSGLERVCKAKTMRFNPEVLVANSWKCTLDEEFDEPNTYIKMESINKYASNGTSEVDAIIKL